MARDRLQILLAHERSAKGDFSLISRLQEKILQLIAKHVAIERGKVIVTVDSGKATSIMEIDIEMAAFGERIGMGKLLRDNRA